MALCSNEILIGYTLAARIYYTVAPYAISPTAIYNGKSYYSWHDDFTGYDLILRWDSVNTRWEFGYDYGGFQQIAFLNFTPTDCPFQPNVPTGPWIVTEIGWSNITTESGDLLPGATTEAQDCFKSLVWNQQCEFAQCVLKYLQLLEFGAAPCTALETLKNERRALLILNCYDVRDIPDNTTNYNTTTYSAIKKLLN